MVKIGELSRNGKSRQQEAPQAADHDMEYLGKLIPFGILNLDDDELSIVFGNSKETSDFIADAIELWWDKNWWKHQHIQELLINLDNGPHIESVRTQFIKRMIHFSDYYGLRIRLVYYPPYHSKYNPIERCWGALERHWNGTILDSEETALKWAATMKWKGETPIIRKIHKTYENGVTLTKKQMKYYEQRVRRSDKVPKWDVYIQPEI